MSRHRSPDSQRPTSLVELALEQAPNQRRGAHRLPTPTHRRGRMVAAAVAAGAVAATGHGLAPIGAGTASAETTAARAFGGVTPTAVSTTSTTAASQPVVLLQRGSRGGMVRELQRVLNAWYPSLTPLAQDGIYGPKTEARVKYLQERADIQVDGIAGPQTFGVLNFPVAAASQGGAVDDVADSAEQTVAEATGADQASEESDSEDEEQASSSESGSVVMPAEGTVTSEFGSRWGSMHSGLDIANSMGTPIYATTDGVVIESGPASGFGLWVRVRHPDDTVSVYGHIHDSLVSEGERVSAGEQIATMGSRGQSTGPHLHFEIWQGGSDKIDPGSWLRNHGVDL